MAKLYLLKLWKQRQRKDKTCLDGGTGRRARLKIWFLQGSGGSIPPSGTKKPRSYDWGFFIMYIIYTIPQTSKSIVEILYRVGGDRIKLVSEEELLSRVQVNYDTLE